MKTHNGKLEIWRRAPFKRALCAAYTDGVINSKQMHELADRFDRIPPFWKTDKFGFPIETFKGRPIKSLFRIASQNLRKLT